MQLTPEGKRIVEDALTDKNWTLETLATESNLSISTVKRFSALGTVRRTSFVTLCQTLGINWREVSEQLQPHSVSVQPSESCSSNPFLQRGILAQCENIYGRDREIRQTFEFLTSGSSVALVGETGLGSSSLLKAIELNAPQKLRDRQPLYLNMGEVLNAEDFYAFIAEPLKIRFKTPFEFQRELKKCRIVLLLDNFEQLAQDWFTAGMRGQLRAWANMGADSPLRLVVAAHRPLTELFEDSGLDSPFANICHEIRLQPWSAETVHGFIETRLAQTGVQFAPEEINDIVQGSGGVPSQVMQWCYRVYERYRD